MVELVSRKPFAEIVKRVICFSSLTISLVWTSQNSKASTIATTPLLPVVLVLNLKFEVVKKPIDAKNHETI